MSSSSEGITLQQVIETKDAPGSSKPTPPNDTKNVEGDASVKKNRSKRTRNRKKNANVLNATEAGTPKPEATNSETTNPGKKPVNKKHNNKPKPVSITNGTATNPASRISKNRAQGRLTTETKDDNDTQSATTPPVKKRNNNNNRFKKSTTLPPGNHDMATVLTHELKNSTYECMICMDIVRPAHHTWTCDCCWAVFHLNCVQTWASKSLKDTSSNKMVTGWRCPGCQNNRTVVPRDYLCFCGKQRNPETSNYNTPHSCDQLCKRHKSCPHECVLPCHPGPCPPCSSMGPTITCYCGHNTRRARCIDTDYSTKGFSCTDICDEILGCGKHRCEETCHAGICPPCKVQEIQSCYCGRHERTARCGSGEQVQLRGHIGYYSCNEKCDTVFMCGQHHCKKSCHPCTANSQACPSDPSIVKTCPCGKHKVEELLEGKNRTSCNDPIPTCESVCGKVSVCGHACKEKCHLGDCPSCEVKVQVPCRCQSTSFEDTCSNVCEAAGGEPPLCERICKSIRNCSKHPCGMKCCPAMKVKGKRKLGTEHVHDCPQVCDQLLSCGIHRCQDMCHKGKCRPCLEAVFDDVTCNCTRTRLEPPVRCGTKLPPCVHPCIRPNPCGHMRFLNHNCHPDDEPCPPCPALVSRPCLCGKTELKNVPCYRESPRCGRPCEKDLACGKHKCRKTCHNGPCIGEGESCSQVCGGTRSCGHACQRKCHGTDTPCLEDEPCTARVKASCKCGQNSIEIPCNATAVSSGSKKDLECNDFCAKVLRNRRLALAFDIKRDDIASSPLSTSAPSTSGSAAEPSRALSSDDLGYYDDSLREFYLENSSWCRHMESSMIDFAQDATKKNLHLKPMRSEYRRFIHRYAVHFNISTEAIDSEPKRSVIIRKTAGTPRVPPILLSKAARNPSLNRPPTTTQGIEADTSGRSASRQPVNALYLTDMAFGLTKLELDADLVPLIKIGNDSIHFTTKWVNENDAVVVPSISDHISMDEKESIIWQLKKFVKAAFLNPTCLKAARVDCCWVNKNGEVTWSEKQAAEEKKNAMAAASSSATTKRRLFVNSYDALQTVDDDGWMRVGGDNPFKPAKDAWIEAPRATAAAVTGSADEEDEDQESKEAVPKQVDTKEEDEAVSTKEEDAVIVNTESNSSQTPESDDWELLLEEDN
ncbi:hypothetical protein BDF21DRAFT_385106 [Thamnidium elegans]|nr:hypothetical protein BDF21DRAFT_385106 [Thamnidium elegans]